MFYAGDLDEDCVFNADETHFQIGMNNDRTLATKEDTDVNFVDVLSVDQGMKITVYIGGGSKSMIGLLFIIFQNPSCSYPILGLLNTFPGVCSRRGRKGWMDSRVFEEWLAEHRIMKSLGDSKMISHYVDNAQETK